jgi:hypothetical protein
MFFLKNQGVWVFVFFCVSGCIKFPFTGFNFSMLLCAPLMLNAMAQAASASRLYFNIKFLWRVLFFSVVSGDFPTASFIHLLF